MPKWIDIAPATSKGGVYNLCCLNGEDFWNGRVVFTALWLRSFTRSSNRSSLFSSATQTTGHWDSEGLSWDQLVLPKCRNRPPSLTHSQGRLKSLGASVPVSFALLGSWGRAECSHWEQQGTFGHLGVKSQGKCSWQQAQVKNCEKYRRALLQVVIYAGSPAQGGLHVPPFWSWQCGGLFAAKRKGVPAWVLTLVINGNCSLLFSVSVSKLFSLKMCSLKCFFSPCKNTAGVWTWMCSKWRSAPWPLQPASFAMLNTWAISFKKTCPKT